VLVAPLGVDGRSAQNSQAGSPHTTSSQRSGRVKGHRHLVMTTVLNVRPLPPVPNMHQNVTRPPAPRPICTGPFLFAPLAHTPTPARGPQGKTEPHGPFVCVVVVAAHGAGNPVDA
jgi:hypothetical protein